MAATSPTPQPTPTPQTTPALPPAADGSTRSGLVNGSATAVLSVVSIILGGIGAVMHGVTYWMAFGLQIEAAGYAYPFFVFPLASLLGFIALVLGVIALVRALRKKSSVVLPVIALVVAVAPTIVVVVIFATAAASQS